MCPVSALTEYLNRTAKIRETESPYVFISTIKPQHRVSRDTISRWVKLAMANSGIDTDMFRSHSTRAAASSAALRKDVPIHAIMTAAGWKSEETFIVFNNKLLHKPHKDVSLSAVLSLTFLKQLGGPQSLLSELFITNRYTHITQGLSKAVLS